MGLIAASKDRIVNSREELSRLRQKEENLQKTLQQVLYRPSLAAVCGVCTLSKVKYSKVDLYSAYYKLPHL